MIGTPVSADVLPLPALCLDPSQSAQLFSVKQAGEISGGESRIDSNNSYADCKCFRKMQLNGCGSDKDNCRNTITLNQLK
jgi:hypothetical protein